MLSLHRLHLPARVSRVVCGCHPAARPFALAQQSRKRATWQEQSHYEDYRQQRQQQRPSLRGPLLFTAAFIATTTTLAVNERKISDAYRRLRHLPKGSSLLPSALQGYRPDYVLVGGIGAVNLLVFLAWQLGRRGRTLRILERYFLMSLHSSRLSMLGSMFSHVGGMHLLFNMIAMSTFSLAVYRSLGPAHTTALYLNAGMIGSLASYAVKLRRGHLGGSLGASAAVYGLVTASTLLAPHQQLQFIFFPFVAFPAYALVPGLVTLDVLGLVLRWNRFDHAGHLGGALGGVMLLTGLLWFYGTQPGWLRRARQQQRK